ncbi:aminopeptidase [Floricoccus penangensis]|uniref:aminopeptidase n=1 Tax=Floricoccus penangensis TaxID=1859475 RepID=UPI003B839DC2
MMATFEENLKKYAELIVKIGVNVQNNHTVVLNIAVDQAPLARLIVKEAYKQGARDVIVRWSDEAVNRERLISAKNLDEIKESTTKIFDEWIEDGASRISVVSGNPAAYEGVNPERIALAQATNGKASRKLGACLQANKFSWLVVAAASPEWAKEVFPELPEDEATDKLWNEIFKATRTNLENPVEAWNEHDKLLTSKAKWLNEQKFDKFHYTAPGTDLVVGLPKNYVFEGPSSYNSRNERFIANMPTEEVFSAPDKKRVDGVVSSTKPLSYAGTIIDGIKLTLEDGRIVDVYADKGQETLEKLVATDEGSHYFGEIALVPNSSPISASGIIFFETLFDENASNHIAIGQAYAFSVEGGTEMSQEQLDEVGLNRSDVHVDFMIGSDKMDIDGVKEDGTIVPIFRNGEWA